MTDELKASYLTGFPSTPAALMIADTDDSTTPYQSILGATTSMPTVTITKKDGEAIREALAAAGGADVYLTVTHSGHRAGLEQPDGLGVLGVGCGPRPDAQARDRGPRRRHHVRLPR